MIYKTTMYTTASARSSRTSVLVAFLFLGACLLLAGCSDFNELNTPEDEIVASNLDVSLLGQSFAYSQYHAMRGQFGSGGYNQIQIHYADMIVQYMAPTAPWFVSDNFQSVRRWDNLGWQYFYETAAPQIDFVEEKTEAGGMELENALAKVWRVEAYHQITDVWGPIPYSKFGNEERMVPYDSQESIYRNFFAVLDSAVTVLEQNTGETAFASDDLIYEGDVGKWLTFANSLRLRLAMRVRYVAPDLARQEAEKAVTAGVMMDPSDSAMLTTTENSQHPLTQITAWGEFRMGAAMESTLEGYSDPRIGDYFNPAANGDSDGDGSPYEGLRNGIPQSQRSTDLNDSYSHMETKWLPLGDGGTNPPMQVMRAAEAYFLRAEGALVGWNMGGTAEELYNEGIRTSLRARTDASEEEIEAYVSSSNTPVAVEDEYNTPALSDIPVAFDTGGSQERKLEQIITQKWLAIYPDGWEAWTEYRRTEYPDLYPLVETMNSNIPVDGMFRRLQFATGEYDSNGQAVEEAIGLLDGQDATTTRLWWDAK